MSQNKEMNEEKPMQQNEKKSTSKEKFMSIFFPSDTAHPSGTAIKSYIETVILLSTLIFAFSTAYFGSFGREDLIAADQDWVSWCNNTNFADAVSHRGWCDDFDVADWESWTNLPSKCLANRILGEQELAGAMKVARAMRLNLSSCS